MKITRSVLSTLAVLFGFATAGHAQFPFPSAEVKPYSYEGYWEPSIRPQGWKHPMTQITFRNLSRGPVDVFYVNRYGRWTWQARMRAGQDHTVTSPVGDTWAVRDQTGRIVQQVHASRRPKVVDIEGHGGYPDSGQGGKLDLVFRNRTDHRVNLQTIDRTGRWIWVGRIPRQSELHVHSFNGQRWVATNDQGKTVKQYQAGRFDDVIAIR